MIQFMKTASRRPYIIATFLACMVLPASTLAQSALKDVKPIDFGAKESLTIIAESGPQVFEIEVADTLEKQSRGMMYRENVPEMTGMLFAFKKPKVATIWMKNTSVSLDILFVRSNGKILKIEHSATPYTLRSASSEAPVAAVVELASGAAMDLGIRPGDLVKHKFFGTENAGNRN